MPETKEQNPEKVEKPKNQKLEEFDFDELDNEVGLGDILKDKENGFVTFLKNLAFVVILIVICTIITFASFTIGKMMFLAEKTSSSTTPPYQENIPTPIPEDNFEEPQPEDNIQIPEEPTPPPPKIEKKVYKPEPPKVPSLKTSTVTSKKYIVVAGTFSSVTNAKNHRKKLTKANIDSTIKTIKSGDRTLYQIAAGAFADINNAKNQVKLLKSKGIDCFYKVSK